MKRNGICSICDSTEVEKVFILPWYSANLKEHTAVLRCMNCSLYFRDVDFCDVDRIKKHFEIAPYDRVSEADKWRDLRTSYFDYLIDEVLKIRNVCQNSRVLDVGCSFGYLLERFSKRFGADCDCYGVEVVDSIRKFANENNPTFHFWEKVEDIPDGVRFDVVTMIDVLYYLDDPVKTLLKLKPHLNRNGIILIRTTNRVWLLDILMYLHLNVKYKHFSDAKFTFSNLSMEYLFNKSGFKIVKHFSVEKHKKVYSKRTLTKYLVQAYYRLSPIGKYIGCNLAPGLLYIVESA